MTRATASLRSPTTSKGDGPGKPHPWSACGFCRNLQECPLPSSVHCLHNLIQATETSKFLVNVTSLGNLPPSFPFLPSPGRGCFIPKQTATQPGHQGHLWSCDLSTCRVYLHRVSAQDTAGTVTLLVTPVPGPVTALDNRSVRQPAGVQLGGGALA